MSSCVKMVHVHQGNGITILIVIQQDADFVEQQFDIEFRYVFREVVVHNDLRYTSIMIELIGSQEA